MMKLNLGAGNYPIEGFVSVDLRDADVCHDLTQFPWPWMHNSVVEIFASHVLEHFDKETGRLFLEECHHILAPEGTLHIAVPDMDKFIEAKNTGNWQALNGYRWTDFNWFLGGDLEGEPRSEQRHRYMYTWESLACVLEDIGFVEVWQHGPCDWDNPAYHAISLYASAMK